MMRSVARRFVRCTIFFELSFGESHHSAKVCEADVRKMRQAHASGSTIDNVWLEFGRPLGVSRSTVEKICLRLSWKHVP